MQLMPRYLLSNRIILVTDVAGFITEYRPVYSRQVQVYKGIDNVLEFRLMNADQRPIESSMYIPKFVAFDENNTMVIEREGVVLDDGSSATRGLFTVTITENDLLNLKQQYLNYNVYLIDVNNDKVLTYSHSNFENDGIMYVNARTFPGPRAAYSVSQFEQTQANTFEWVSESVYAHPAINGNEALHTAAIYTAGYFGEIRVQATLDNSVTESTDWADVATVIFDGTEEEPVPVNFNGVFSFIRFIAYSNPADLITKILVRN